MTHEPNETPEEIFLVAYRFGLKTFINRKALASFLKTYDHFNPVVYRAPLAFEPFDASVLMVPKPLAVYRIKIGSYGNQCEEHGVYDYVADSAGKETRYYASRKIARMFGEGGATIVTIHKTTHEPFGEMGSVRQIKSRWVKGTQRYRVNFEKGE